MGTEEKIDEMFREEMARSLDVNEVTDFPVTISVEQDDLPNIERWRNNE